MALFCDRLCCNRPRVSVLKTLRSSGIPLLHAQDLSRRGVSFGVLHTRKHGLSSISKPLPISRHQICLRAAWVEPLVVIGVPMLLASLFSWSLYQINTLRAQIRNLQSINANSEASLKESSISETKMEVQIEESNDNSPEVNQLTDQIIEIKKAWSVDRQRMKTLEKARSAAVKDVTNALASKQDVEFKLKESLEHIQILETELNTQNAKVAQMEDLLHKEQSQITALHQQKSQLEQKLQDLNNQCSDDDVKSESDEGSTDGDSSDEIAILKRQLREAQEEANLAHEYARSELKLMTLDLIRVRDQKTQLTLQTENLTINLSRAEKRIKELNTVLEQSQTNSVKSSSSDIPDSIVFSDDYLHEMRAEAALMVEEIEDKAHFDLEYAMKRSRTAEKTALKGLMKAAKEKEKAVKLQKNLEDAQDEIEIKQKEIWYLKDRIRVLMSDREHLSVQRTKSTDLN